MVTGRVLKLTGVTLNAPNAPKLKRIDPIESEGSILLIDATHPSQSWPSGSAHGLVFPNLLADKGVAVTGLSETDVTPTFTTSGLGGTRGLVERSGKGGLHAIYSNTNTDNKNGTNGQVWAYPVLPTALKQYLVDHWGDNIYMSAWVRFTRNSPGTPGLQPQAPFQLANSTSATGNFKYFFYHAGQNPASGTTGFFSRKGTWSDANGDTPGPQLLTAARSGYTNTAPTVASSLQAFLFFIGNGGTINSWMTAKENGPSAILYRAYMENLTVSGRTWSEVDAIDYQLYTKEVLTSGGRYEGDTFTDPATIP